jgi:tRNA (mo5U34)-methyltransferase
MDLHQINDLNTLARDPVIGPFVPELMEQVAAHNQTIFHRNKKGVDLARALDRLPHAEPSFIDVDGDRIRIGIADDLEGDQTEALLTVLQALKPWRKGPFDVFGIQLDSEWNSAIKWNRLADHLGPQTGKRVLDIGSSCGYYMFRLAARMPTLVIGIEPYLNFYFQFLALSRYLALPRLYCLPLKLEEMPIMHRCFDTVLCMGILYHRRSPLDTLLSIHGMMAPGGQLVLETLIVEGDTETALFPEKRYARMGNIFFLPTVKCLEHWLKRCGFGRIRCVNISKTTSAEQRRTDWIDTQSLADFLDSDDPDKTVEGYPAPLRAMVLATALPG